MASEPAAARTADVLLTLARELAAMAADESIAELMAAESVRLSRKVSLLVHLIEEIRDFAVRNGGEAISSSSPAAKVPWSCLSEVVIALKAVKRFFILHRGKSSGEISAVESNCKNMTIQYQYVAWQLEKALGNIPYEYFKIPDEVQEEAELVRAQLRRETEKVGSVNLLIFQEMFTLLSSLNAKALKRQSQFKLEEVKYEPESYIDPDLLHIVIIVAKVSGKSQYFAEKMAPNLIERLKKSGFVDLSGNLKAENRSRESGRSMEEESESDSPVIPEDFLCPISLELMRDPVIVSTGQTYERSSIQRWVNCGNRTCPKTQQKLQNLTLTPNFVLRSLIMQWCEANTIEQPAQSISTTKNNHSLSGLTGEGSSIHALVSKLTSPSPEDQKSSAAEIRLLTKCSTKNRTMLSKAGAIPALVSLLSSNDQKIQEHAVTSLHNLSIYDQNKEVIILAGAINPIIEVLKCGNMEARENAAAAIFSLSLIDENKISIGAVPGAMEALIKLLETGSLRGKKDAASALFNLCIYRGNKGRAIREGIIGPLLLMLKDSESGFMVDEALTLLSLLVSHEEGKEAVKKANAVSILVGFVSTGKERNKENAVAVLLGICQENRENLACLGRMGAVVPLKEVEKSGTDRAKRKAAALLELLEKIQIH
ncbi:U-box domain-containing protein 11-like [Phalaenopsis equestris]|uniref:U-box domain-containing protein 11-like n=1 Tax=Phalaenopsis equestris TaxID=78828 RepID=UPI0009E3FE28|nr:U-box domain-containing protein 11-like [Phalaenopsis equestris]